MQDAGNPRGLICSHLRYLQHLLSSEAGCVPQDSIQQPEQQRPTQNVEHRYPLNIDLYRSVTRYLVLLTMENRVLVVGAGLAGLSAARELSHRGYQVTVLEGRDRVGGRLWSSNLDGGSDVSSSVDLGAVRKTIDLFVLAMPCPLCCCFHTFHAPIAMQVPPPALASIVQFNDLLAFMFGVILRRFVPRVLCCI